MPATDLVLVAEQRLWALALAWPGFTSIVRVGNRVRFDQLGILWPKNVSAKQAADAPEVRLDVGTFSRSPLSKLTFCAATNWKLQGYVWTIIGSSLKINEIGQVRAEIEAFMDAAGQDLGIPTTVAKVERQPGAYEAAPMALSGVPNGPQGAQAKQIRVVYGVHLKG